MSAARRIKRRDDPRRKHKRFVRRLSRGMDLPYRVLFDASLFNHWSAWDGRTAQPGDPSYWDRR